MAEKKLLYRCIPDAPARLSSCARSRLDSLINKPMFLLNSLTEAMPDVLAWVTPLTSTLLILLTLLSLMTQTRFLIEAQARTCTAVMKHFHKVQHAAGLSAESRKGWILFIHGNGFKFTVLASLFS